MASALLAFPAPQPFLPQGRGGRREPRAFVQAGHRGSPLLAPSGGGFRLQAACLGLIDIADAS